ncbi:N-6 DNA methylase [Streptomyces sp. NPDC004629]|uniref:N-6 DNA methylase n=1 Tax=Streptomyces sp. NPDC004629 TaxID=3364705 RepID=UPI003697EA92
MLLHGIGRSDGPSLIHVGDALAEKSSGRHATLVVANPPFGRKSAITVIGQDGEDEKEDIQYDRHDFTATTTNKQLNLLQRIMSLTPVGGRAAVVLPDNVLFEGGAGEKVPGRRARRSLGRHPWAVSAEDHLGRSEGLTVIRGYA